MRYPPQINMKPPSREDEAEILKRMHKQASLNQRQAPPIKSNYRRRVDCANLEDPLNQYKPGGLKIKIDYDIIQSERGHHNPIAVGLGRQIPVYSNVNNGAITNRNNNP